MSIESAEDYLKKFGLDNRILRFEASSATVELAAKALNCDPARIAKSLTFYLNEQPIMILAAGDMKVDNKKYKEVFSSKAKMLTPEQAEELIGHSIGGVCPFGVKNGVQVYLDVSLKRFSTVFPACGGSNTAIELSIPELEKTSGYKKWVDVCKPLPCAEGEFK